jgi:hypothetical protein
MHEEAPRYRAIERLTIRTREIAVGEEFEFEGKPGPALLPINEAARKNKLRAIVDGPGPHRPVEPIRMARSLGYGGNDQSEARAFIQQFVSRETARQPTASPTAKGN